jgi:hypothetical protein
MLLESGWKLAKISLDLYVLMWSRLQGNTVTRLVGGAFKQCAGA